MVRRVGAAGLGLVLVGLLAGSALGAYKPKDGAYMQPSSQTKAGAYVTVEKGKVIGLQASLFYKDAAGKECEPEGGTTVAGQTAIYLVPKNPVAVKDDRSFKFSSSKNTGYPGLSGTVEGKFKSGEKARFTVKSKFGSCKAQATFTRAKLSSGR